MPKTISYEWLTRVNLTDMKTEIVNDFAISELECMRDLLCAFHRDYPHKYTDQVKEGLRSSLAIIERSKNTQNFPGAALDLLLEWVADGECFCAEGVALRGPCTFCKTKAYLKPLA